MSTISPMLHTSKHKWISPHKLENTFHLFIVCILLTCCINPLLPLKCLSSASPVSYDVPPFYPTTPPSKYGTALLPAVLIAKPHTSFNTHKLASILNGAASSIQLNLPTKDETERYGTNILRKQIWKELQKHNSDAAALLSDIGMEVLKYSINVLKNLILGISLLLPFHTRLDGLGRVELNDPYLLNFYNLPENASPASFGLNYNNVSVKSSYDDKLLLDGWLVPSEDPNSRKAVICVHGWNSNRQSCLPFLNVARMVDVLKDHHAFLFDSRNTGASSTVQKDTGIGAAQDIFDVLLYLKTERGISHVSFYCQSMGALAFMVLMDTYKQQLTEMGIHVDRVVLESPIWDIKDAVRVQLSGLNDIPSIRWVLDMLFTISQRNRRKNLTHSPVSELLNNVNPRKTLILQSLDDPYLNWNVLKTEISKMNAADVPKDMYLFERGQHANIQKHYTKEYESLIRQHFKWFPFYYLFYQKSNNKSIKRIDWRDYN